MAGAAMLALASCNHSDGDGGKQESAEQIEAAATAGREAARKFINTLWEDTLALQGQLLEARAAGSKYDVAGPKQKAAYDSAFVSTIRTVRPAVAEHLIRAKANADRAKRAAAADKK